MISLDFQFQTAITLMFNSFENFNLQIASLQFADKVIERLSSVRQYLSKLLVLVPLRDNPHMKCPIYIATGI